MMALLIKSHHEKYPDDRLEAVTNAVCYAIARSCIPDDCVTTFDDEFKPLFSPENNDYVDVDGFILTPSRQVVAESANTALRT